MAMIDHVDSVDNTHDWRGNVQGMAEVMEQVAGVGTTLNITFFVSK
jgi:hypothetical protein